MLRFIASLFGCAHSRCTFPMTTTKHHHSTTYIVCLECGKEFSYDWQEMRMGAAKEIHAVA